MKTIKLKKLAARMSRKPDITKKHWSKRQLTKDECLRLMSTDTIKRFNLDQVFRLGFFQQRLCVPFDLFHESAEYVMQRPVWVHEFAKHELLYEEYIGRIHKPTIEEIVTRFPSRNTVIAVA